MHGGGLSTENVFLPNSLLLIEFEARIHFFSFFIGLFLDTEESDTKIVLNIGQGWGAAGLETLLDRDRAAIPNDLINMSLHSPKMPRMLSPNSPTQKEMRPTRRGEIRCLC